VAEYVRGTTSAFDTTEFNKVFGATYDFRRVDLSAISVPTLVLDGEFESDAVFEHTAHLERSLSDVRTAVVPDAGHTSNMENPDAFTAELRTFLDEVAAES
jgi:pimeloyl-ACP methyl ester carboxylesterase